MDVDLATEPLGHDPDGEPVYLRDIWPSAEEVAETIADAVRSEMFSRTYANVYDGDEAWRALDTPDGDLFAWEPGSTYVRRPPYFDGMSPEPGHRRRHRGRPLPRDGRRLGHDRPHLARRLDQARLARRPLPGRARRRARRLQLVRLTARQPRGDGARHVRQRAAAQPARPRQRGHLDRAPALGRGDDDLRRRRTLPRRGRADDRDRGQGVRLRLVARLGREGPEAARREGGARGELRADPPLEPADDGDPAAPVRARRDPGDARAHGPRGVLDRRASRTARPAR